jgi:hypothetical protein
MSGNAKISRRTNTPAAIQKQVPPLLQIRCHQIQNSVPLVFSMETMMLTKPVPIDFPVRLGKNLTLIDLSNRETI